MSLYDEYEASKPRITIDSVTFNLGVESERNALKAMRGIKIGVDAIAKGGKIVIPLMCKSYLKFKRLRSKLDKQLKEVK